MMQLRLFEKSPINIAQVKHYSPFRYPGGKTWFVPYVKRFLLSIGRKKRVVEPFAGGGSVSLSLVFEGFCNEAIIERDRKTTSFRGWRIKKRCEKYRFFYTFVPMTNTKNAKMKEIVISNHRIAF